MRANLHHVPWPLEEAEAEIERNDLAAAIGIHLPDQEPVLHYSRRLAVYVWPAELVRPLAGSAENTGRRLRLQDKNSYLASSLSCSTLIVRLRFYFHL